MVVFLLITFEGVDRSGKSTAMIGVADFLKKKGKKIFDTSIYEKQTNELPTYNDFSEYDVYLLSEPSYAKYGRFLREHALVSKDYSPRYIADLFSEDRFLKYISFIIPAHNNRKIILQDRDIASSFVYQPLDSELRDGTSPISVDEIKKLRGNEIALRNLPDMLIILQCPPEISLKRRMSDKLSEKHFFEELAFQEKVSERYNSDWLREIFESGGTNVLYVDASGKKEDLLKEIKNTITPIFSNQLQ